MTRETTTAGAEWKGGPVFTLIRQARIFAPQDFGTGDILLAGNIIAAVGGTLDPPPKMPARIVDGRGLAVTPGWIDLHVHITGGGGEGGPATRVPEIRLTDIVEAGVTTVVGLLGTDDVSRTPAALLAKALGLEQQGLNVRILSGSYAFPPVQTITGSLKKDLMCIPHVVGVGELAISDHRSSQPTFADLAKVAAEARVGGILGNKPGLVNLHMGDGRDGLDPLFRLIRETEIPITQLLPTHVNRNRDLFAQSLEFLEAGGCVDVTVYPDRSSAPSLSLEETLHQVIERCGSLQGVTLSSDGNGSLPKFDAQGHLLGMGVGQIDVLRQAFRRLILEDGFHPDILLPCLTSQPAARLNWSQRKGRIATGMDADLVLFDAEWRVRQVYCRGRMMVDDGHCLVKGPLNA